MAVTVHRRDNADEWFWGNADRSTGCWIWTGRTFTPDGRGIVFFEGRMQTVGSVAYQLAHGPMPEGKETCHDCRPNPDNGSCIHPSHVWAGTHSENVADRWAKYRSAHPGEPLRKRPDGTHPRYEYSHSYYLERKRA